MRRIGLPFVGVSLALGLVLTGQAVSDIQLTGAAETSAVTSPAAAATIPQVANRPLGFDIADADAAELGEETTATWTADALPPQAPRTLAVRPPAEGPELILSEAGQAPSAPASFSREAVAEVRLSRQSADRPSDRSTRASEPAQVLERAALRARTVSIPGVLLPERPRGDDHVAIDRARPESAPATVSRPEPAPLVAAPEHLAGRGASPAPAAPTVSSRALETTRLAPRSLPVPSATIETTSPARTASAPRLEPAVMVPLPDTLTPRPPTAPAGESSSTIRTEAAPIARTAVAPPAPVAERSTARAGMRSPATNGNGRSSAPLSREPESPVVVTPAWQAAPLARPAARAAMAETGTLVAAPESVRRMPAAPASAPTASIARVAPAGPRPLAAPATPPPPPEIPRAIARTPEEEEEAGAPVESNADVPGLDAQAKIRAEARAVEARALFRQAMALYEAQAYEQALSLFETATELDPDFAEAREYRRRTLGLLGRSGPDEADRVLENIIRSVEHSRQAAEMQLRTELEKAERLYLSAMEPSPARQDLPRPVQVTEEVRDLRLAREKLDRVATLLAGSTLPAPTQEQLRLRIEALRGRIAQALDRRMEEQDAIARREALESTEEMRERTRRTQEEQVDELVRQARAFMERHEYDKAIEIAEEILEGDPDNKIAQSLLADARRERHTYVEWELRKDWKHRREIGELNLEYWHTAQSEDLEYPDDWDRILRRSEREGILGGGSEMERELRQRLNQVRTSVEFRQTPLEDVVDHIAQVGNVNIALDDTNLDDPVDPQAPVTFAATDATLMDILEWAMELTDNRYEIRDEVVWVTRTSSDRTFTQVFDVSDLVTPSIHFFPEEDDDDDDTDIEDQTLAETIQELIQPDSWERDDVSINLWRDSLVVVQTEEVQEAIREYLDSVRAFTKQQVLVDVRVLDVNQDWLEEIGFRWGNDSHILNPYEGWGFLHETLEDNGDYLRVDSRFLPVTGATSFGGSQGFMVNFLDNLTFLDNLQVQGFLHAVQQEQHGTVLHQPKLLITSGLNAMMEVLTIQEYVEEWDIEDERYLPVKADLEQGMSMGVQPIVSFDGKYVTLRLSPTLTILDQENTITRTFDFYWIIEGEGDNPDTVANSTLGWSSLVVGEQRVRTTATVPNGGTILLGGLVRDDRIEQMSGIPLVSDIPYLGSLFRSRSTTSTGSNIIYMVGANIIELE